MKEELAEKAGLAMVDIIESMVKAKDFAVEQAPDVVAQLLTYSVFVSLAWSILWTICLTVSAWGIYKFVKLVDGDDDWIPGVIFSVVMAIIFSCSLYTNAFGGWVKIWLAPKVWLLEYAASLASS